MSDLEGKSSVAETDYVLEELVTPSSLASLSAEELNAVRRKATRKIDLVVMPSITLMYILNYLDRQNISAAKIAGITKDLHLTAVQYQMCISFLFVGYILFQVPSNMFLGKSAYPALYINVMMAVWGVVSAATGVVKSFGGLIACRTVLGCLEAAFFPGALYYLSCWYTKKQLAGRTALLYCGSQLGNAFGGLFAIAILKLDGKAGRKGWEWLFIIEGVATVGIAIILAIFMPNSPSSCKFLKGAEKDYIIHSLAKEQGAQDDRNELGVGAAFKLVVTDPKTYLLMGVLYSTYIAAAVVNFFPSVVATLGYSRNMTYVLTAPPYLLCCITMLINGWHSDKTQERFWHIVCPMAFALVANVIAVASLNTGARYFAMMLMPTSLYSSAIVTLSWISGSLTQPALKRALAISFINASCNTPNVWTPYLYKTAPRYIPAFSVNIVAVGLVVVFAVATRVYLKQKNDELERGDYSARGGPTEHQVASGFRYLI